MEHKKNLIPKFGRSSIWNKPLIPIFWKKYVRTENISYKAIR